MDSVISSSQLGSGAGRLCQLTAGRNNATRGGRVHAVTTAVLKKSSPAKGVRGTPGPESPADLAAFNAETLAKLNLPDPVKEDAHVYKDEDGYYHVSRARPYQPPFFTHPPLMPQRSLC